MSPAASRMRHNSAPMDLYDAWNASLEEIKRRVTGVGVWTALNVAIPVVLEDGVFVLGFRPQDQDLMGHLKMAGTRRAIEEEISKRVGQEVSVHLLDGITIHDWQSFLRRQEESKKLQAKDFEKAKREVVESQKWDHIYEQVSREYNALPNKALPQQRAKLLNTCIELVAQELKDRDLDDASDRQYSRCLERIETYTEVPAALIAKFVNDKLSET